MNTLANIFRRSSRSSLYTTTAVTRKPKKKGGKAKGGAGPVSDDIVNIFKEREDPIILPSEYYPQWIFQHLDKPISSEEVLDHIKYGRYVPSGDMTYTLMRSLQRSKIRLQNDYGGEEEVYDSDEDWREPDDGEVAFIMNKEAQEAKALLGSDEEEEEE
eukprot:CAMPEP_0197005586 /NCGR_PEP_ID=MMETSP1380-20130617/30103_1 /TAXON_ID=5936 /ORGANISM="Euplotes crassus, Strain CT5" /LENGTH=158 /DNA_ID=CAMNT_0042424775 /DNA_START=19 /DNA_END=495 /DNA_ORIENTATION=+